MTNYLNIRSLCPYEFRRAENPHLYEIRPEIRLTRRPCQEGPHCPRSFHFSYGAQREGRTPTLLREPDFESGASASSAIRAQPQVRLATGCFSNMMHREGQPVDASVTTISDLHDCLFARSLYQRSWQAQWRGMPVLQSLLPTRCVPNGKNALTRDKQHHVRQYDA
jgi:hypothetical protein